MLNFESQKPTKYEKSFKVGNSQSYNIWFVICVLLCLTGFIEDRVLPPMLETGFIEDRVLPPMLETGFIEDRVLPPMLETGFIEDRVLPPMLETDFI